MALARKNRLADGEDLKRILRSKEGGRGAFLLLRASPGNTANSRLGIIVSKKVSAKAVERNRIKRALSAAAADFIESSKYLPWDMAVTVLPSAAGKTNQELKDDLIRILGPIF